MVIQCHPYPTTFNLHFTNSTKIIFSGPDLRTPCIPSSKFYVHFPLLTLFKRMFMPKPLCNITEHVNSFLVITT